MKNTLLIILSLFCFSCKDHFDDKSKRNENWVWWVDAKTKKAGWIPVDKGEPVKNGRYTRFYFNGNKSSTGKLVDGTEADTIFYYDIRGHLQEYKIPYGDSIEYYINNGPIKMFYPNGGVEVVGFVKNHIAGDNWTGYFENNKIEFIRNLKNDTGWVTSYYKNGRVSDSDYVEGKKLFNIKRWYENGQLRTVNEFKLHDYNGFQKQYYPSGKLKGIGFWLNGKGNGEAKSWYENGKLQSLVHRLNGEYDGVQTVYYENGNVNMVGHMKNGKLNGERKQYNENGILMKDDMYENGIKVESKIKDPFKS